MKKAVLYFILLFASQFAFAGLSAVENKHLFSSVVSYTANNIEAYEYWFDNNYSQKVYQSVTPVSALVLNTSINTGTLSAGLHSFNIRYKDSYNNWSVVSSELFYKPISTFTQSSSGIVAYEYWFDTNYGQKVFQTVTSTTALVVSSSIATGTMNAGLHSFNIRFKDSYNEWSVVSTQLFYKPVSTFNQSGANLIAYEYWFDTNYAQKVFQSITPATSFVLNSSIATGTINPGVHSFNIRFKDSYNNWSVVSTQLFYKAIDSFTQTGSSLVAYEYWFDTNYAQKVFQSITPASTYILSSSVSTGTISAGVHAFNIRFKDNFSKWSVVSTSLFYKAATGSNISSNKIKSYTYWRDTLYSQRTLINLATPVNPLLLNAPISMTAVPKGKHLFNIQFKDSTNKWSVVQADSFMKASLPIASFSVNNTVFCDTGIVQFTNQSIDGDIYNWNFGDASSSTLTSVSHTYTAPGSYTVSLSITDTITLQNSTYTMNIIVSGKPVFSLGSNTLVCPNSGFTLSAIANQASYLWSTNATSYSIQPTVAGNYWCKVTNSYGCWFTDTITVGFKRLPIASFSSSVNGLQVSFTNYSSDATSYSWDFGDNSNSSIMHPNHTYLIPGSYTVTLVASNSCGSYTVSDIVTVNGVGLNSHTALIAQVLVFPNPNKGVFDVYLEGALNTASSFELQDLSGRLIERVQIESNEAHFKKTFDVQDLDNGVYHLIIANAQYREVRKIIVAK